MGIVGGTFDPVHLGHIGMAEAARACAGLDLVLLLPASSPPHRAPPQAPAPDRLVMCRLATDHLPWLEVSDLELRRRGASYTVDTLRQLRDGRPADELYLVLGWDAARELGHWREPGEIQRLAGLVVVTRPGLPVPAEGDLKAAGIQPGHARVCDVPTPSVVGTEVRRLIATGAPLDGVLDPAVAAYIRSRGLYRAGGDNAPVG